MTKKDFLTATENTYLNARKDRSFLKPPKMKNYIDNDPEMTFDYCIGFVCGAVTGFVIDCVVFVEYVSYKLCCDITFCTGYGEGLHDETEYLKYMK
jgi:hypothetical protein